MFVGLSFPCKMDYLVAYTQTQCCVTNDVTSYRSVDVVFFFVFFLSVSILRGAFVPLPRLLFIPYNSQGRHVFRLKLKFAEKWNRGMVLKKHQMTVLSLTFMEPAQLLRVATVIFRNNHHPCSSAPCKLISREKYCVLWLLSTFKYSLTALSLCHNDEQAVCPI